MVTKNSSWLNLCCIETARDGSQFNPVSLQPRKLPSVMFNGAFHCSEDHARLAAAIVAIILLSPAVGCGEGALSDAPNTVGSSASIAGSPSVGGTPSQSLPAAEPGGSATGGSAGTPACGDGAGKFRGRSTQALTIAGLTRTFVLYESTQLDAKKPAPLVIAAHHLWGTGENMEYLTGYDAIAESDSDGLVVAYPDGYDPDGNGHSTWNVGENFCQQQEMSDLGLVAIHEDIDQPFLNAIIEFVNADQCVDRNHVYITGLSMGGYFTNETACTNPNFRAGAPHSAGSHDLSACLTKHTPILILHFESDAAIPYTCGTEARDRWVAHNGCSLTDPNVKAVRGGTCEYYAGCPADGQVALCKFQEPVGGSNEWATGHGWSGGALDPFSIPPTESASELSWTFFRQYAW